MSVRVMTAVWGLDLPDSEKIVLLALADSANDEGHCWPGMKSLVAKCSKTDRTVQACIKSLCDKGHLTRREVPGKGCNYTVHPRTGCTPEETSPPKGTTQTPEAASGKPSRTVNTGAKAPLGAVVTAWNEMAKKTGLAPVRVLDNSRKQALRLREKEHGEATLLEAVAIVGRSPWLKGEGRDGAWRPGIDFILQPSSLRKVLEGNYGGLEETKPALSPADIRKSREHTAALYERMGKTAEAAELRRMIQGAAQALSVGSRA